MTRPTYISVRWGAQDLTPDHDGVVRSRDGRPYYPLGGGYAEQHWLPVVGPTAWLLARRLAHTIGHLSGSIPVEVVSLAHALGVGPGRMWAAMQRLARHRLVTLHATSDTTMFVTVCKFWPEVPEHRKGSAA